jgi:hypothetical protein
VTCSVTSDDVVLCGVDETRGMGGGTGVTTGLLFVGSLLTRRTLISPLWLFKWIWYRLSMPSFCWENISQMQWYLNYLQFFPTPNDIYFKDENACVSIWHGINVDHYNFSKKVSWILYLFWYRNFQLSPCWCLNCQQCVVTETLT